MADASTRNLRRFLFKNAAEIEFDKNGRFIIPSVLREYAHLDGAATVIGTGEDIEVWSPELLKKQDEQFDSPDLAAELAEKFDLSIYDPNMDSGSASPHVSVLYQPIITALRPKSPGFYVDATIGAGGHAWGILEQSSPKGQLLGLDVDPRALELAHQRLFVF